MNPLQISDTYLNIRVFGETALPFNLPTLAMRRAQIKEVCHKFAVAAVYNKWSKSKELNYSTISYIWFYFAPIFSLTFCITNYSCICLDLTVYLRISRNFQAELISHSVPSMLQYLIFHAV